LGRTKNLVAGLELGRFATSNGLRGLQDDTRELGSGYPWKRWLMLIFSGYLEEVKEVGGGGMNGD